MVKFISHYKDTGLGGLITLIEERGNASGVVYWYNDDDTVIYLASLSVGLKFRNQGIGTKLQEMREEIGIQRGATCARLWVKKDTWMHHWYKRRGYTDFQDYKNGVVWMKKSLKLNYDIRKSCKGDDMPCIIQ